MENNNNNHKPFIEHLLGARPYAPCFMCILLLIVAAPLCDRESGYPHFAEGKTEAQRKLSKWEGC